MSWYLRILLVNLVTGCGLLFGLLSIKAALEFDFVMQCWLLTACLFADGADGYLARKLGAVTRFGAFADTSADFIAFGLSPSAAVLVSQGTPNVFTLILAAMWIGASVARLCFFMRTNDSSNTNFKGLPLAAGSFALVAFVISSDGAMSAQLGFAIIVVLTALMLSRLEFKRDRAMMIAIAMTYGVALATVSQIRMEIYLSAMYGSVLYIFFSLIRSWTSHTTGGITRAAATIK